MTTAVPARSRDPAILRRLARTITSELGIKMPDAKLPILRNRLQRRLQQLGLASLDDYVIAAASFGGLLSAVALT